MKRLGSSLLHLLELMILALGAVGIGSIPIGIPLIALAFIPASKLHNDIMGNEIKNSIFSVSKDGKIVQNGLAKPLRILSLIGKKDKNTVFTEEIMNMFLEIKKYNNKGKEIVYHTRSHAFVYYYLRKLEQNGYIENLTKVEAGKSSLFFERLLIGNFNNLFKRKKQQMFKMSFKLTDKPRVKEDLQDLLKGKKKIDNNQDNNTPVKTIEYENQSTLSTQKEEQHEPTIEELKELREQLLASQEEDTNKKTY